MNGRAARQPPSCPTALRGFGEFALERFPFAARRGPRGARSRVAERRGQLARRSRPSTTCALPSSAALEQRLSHLLPAGLGDTTPASCAGSASRRRSRSCSTPATASCGAPRSRLADRRRAPRDPARHAAHARHRQSPEDVLHERRGALRRRAVPGQGLPLARTGSDLRRRRSGCGAATRTATATAGTATSSRRSFAISASTLAMRHDAPRRCAWCCRRRWARPGRRWTARICTPAISRYGILPAAAPLAIGTLTLAGMALAFAREGCGRVALSFIGEGGSSLGEWHEAINLCAARKLPAIFCLQNNQTALSTPVREQSAVRVFADKAAGYGIPGITIDGTDPDEIAAAFAWAVERARAGLRADAHRARGDAHVRPRASRRHALSRQGSAAVVGLPARCRAGGYADRERYAYWSGARSDRQLCGAARGRRRHRARASSSA